MHPTLNLPPFTGFRFWNADSLQISRKHDNPPKLKEEWEALPEHASIWCVALESSGVCVVDIDCKPGQANGYEFAKQKLGWDIDALIASTYAVRTKSGGLHLYYVPPPHITYKSKLGTCIDLLAGSMNLVVCPPTQNYTVLNSPEILAPLPRFIIDVWAPRAIPQPAEAREVDDVEGYRTNCLKRARGIVASALPGERNEVLNKQVFWMAQLGVPLQTVKEEMIKATTTNGDLIEDSGKVFATLNRAYSDGKEHPINLIPKVAKLAQTDILNAVVATQTSNIICAGGTWYERTSQSGYWKEASAPAKALLASAARTTLKELPMSTKQFQKEMAPKSILCTTSALQGMREWYCDSDFFEHDDNLIMCGDDVFDLAQGRVIHIPEFRTNRRTLPLQTGNCTAWLDFLKYAFEGDEEMIHWLRLSMVYSLSGQTDWTTMYSVYGQPKTGKSTFMRVLAAVSGEFGVSATEGTLLRVKPAENQYLANFSLIGRRVLMKSELREGAVFNSDNLKAITSGDLVTARGHHRKFEQVKLKTKIWMASNDLPHFGELDAGLQRRLRIVAMDRAVVSTSHDYFETQLQPILGRILAWVLEAGPEMTRGEPRPPERVLNAVQEACEDEQPMTQFLRECLVEDPDGFVSTAKAFGNYAEWCSRNGEPLPDPRLVKYLGKVLVRFCKQKVERPYVGGVQTRGFKGWKLID